MKERRDSEGFAKRSTSDEGRHPGRGVETEGMKERGWPRLRAWVGRLGAAGFAFFLIKGLLWLTIPWLIARGLW